MGLLDNFPHLANAYVRTRVSDGLGGGQDSFGLVFSNRRCWRQNASDREIVELGRRGISVTNRIYFLSDPELDETHSLIIGSDVYEVRSRATPDASSGLGIVWRVMAEHTNTGTTEL